MLQFNCANYDSSAWDIALLSKLRNCHFPRKGRKESIESDGPFGLQVLNIFRLQHLSFHTLIEVIWDKSIFQHNYRQQSPSVRTNDFGKKETLDVVNQHFYVDLPRIEDGDDNAVALYPHPHPPNR
jgi:hypothetical protein